MEIKRCKWVNLKNPNYIKYHDEEWGMPKKNDKLLFELLILECFQAGLSWECILNKRNGFRLAFDNFDVDIIASYSCDKIETLIKNPNIIRNKLKIKATINNAKIFKKIQKEFGTYANYIWQFTDGKVIKEEYTFRTSSPLSDVIAKDLRARGMHFVGTTIIYSYLQAIGIINGHAKDCICYGK